MAGGRGRARPGRFVFVDETSTTRTLRRRRARAPRGVRTIGEALDRVTPDHARAWFNHCGYRLSAQA